MTAPAVEFRGVSKRYPHFALEHVSFRLARGQIMGFVGPNGAGKSTSLRILMGLVRHDAGEVEVLGCGMPHEQVRAKRDVAYVSEDMKPFDGATIGWHLGFARSIHPGWDGAYAERLLERFDLRAARPTRGLSHGERIKLLLVLALARRPRLLVLDEPTSGLDPVARHEVLAELMDVVHDEERSIVFSSHNTLDVEQICDQITFLDRGRIVASDDKESYLERWRRIVLELAPDAALPELPGLVDVQRSGRVATLTLEAWDDAVAAACAGAGALEVQRMTLEEIFVATVLHHRRERGR